MNSPSISTRAPQRAAPVAGLTILSAIAVAAALAAYLVTAPASEWLSNASWTLAALGGVIGVAYALRASTPDNRSAWRILLFATIAWLAGQCAWDAYALTAYPSSPNLADFLWYAFAGLTAIAVYRFGGAPQGRHISRLEVTSLVIAVCALLIAVLWEDIQNSVLSTGGELAALAYPVIYVTAVVVMGQAILAGGLSGNVDRGVTLMFGGLLLEAVAFILWTPQLLAASYVQGTSALDVLWTGGLVMFGVGALIANPRAPANVDEIQARRGGVLPSLTFFAVAVVQVVYGIAHEVSFAIIALALGMLIIGTSLATRSAVLRRQHAEFRERLRLSEEELREVNERLNRESRRDPLTGLGNRLRLNEDLDALVARNRREPQIYAAAIFDIDRFKAYNDSFGHQAGDIALGMVSTILREQRRGGDSIYRYGGEEILLLMTGSSSESAQSAAERLRAAVEDACLQHPANQPFGIVTISGGVAVAQPGESPEYVIARADASLYEAKALGRNQVVEAELSTGPKAGPVGAGFAG